MNFPDLLEQQKNLETDLADPKILFNPKKVSALSKEYKEVKEKVALLEKIQIKKNLIRDAQDMTKQETDPEILNIAKEDIEKLFQELDALEAQKNELFASENEPFREKNIIVEIRQAAGGNEAGLFAANLCRMYTKYTEQKGWEMELLSMSRTGIGGIKEAIFSIRGDHVYQQMRYESGVHRVQRIPETEKSNRIHTSTVTVAVFPEAEDVDIKINPEDVRVEASTAQGHGGQSVNTTYSAIRLTHIPTGIVVSCQNERSQTQNKEQAFTILRARLFDIKQREMRAKEANARKLQIGTGDRSEKIRTYNIQQDRITDHRIKENFHHIQRILDGDLDVIINKLQISVQSTGP